MASVATLKGTNSNGLGRDGSRKAFLAGPSTKGKLASGGGNDAVGVDEEYPQKKEGTGGYQGSANKKTNDPVYEKKRAEFNKMMHENNTAIDKLKARQVRHC